MNLVRGANALLAGQGRVTVIIKPGVCPGAVELTCFLVDEKGIVPSAGCVVSPGQSRDAADAVHLATQAGTATFAVDLQRVPPTVRKCVFTASLATGAFRQVQGMQATVSCAGQELVYQLADAGDERTMLLAELYRHASGWKFRAVGQGFAGDATTLARMFGATLPSAPPPSAPRSPPPPRPAEASQQPVVRLGKILLDKPTAFAALSLAKGAGGPLQVRVRMTWHAGVDLDLHAFYRLKDGATGHVYFADKGNLRVAPWIALDQDAAVDRRAGEHEENLTISKIDAVQTILFAANIFTLGGLFGFGSDNFARYDGVVTVSTGNQDIVVPLASSEPGRWAVIARLDNGLHPRVTRIDRIVKKQPTLADFPGGD